jgi:hypothetical protein
MTFVEMEMRFIDSKNVPAVIARNIFIERS